MWLCEKEEHRAWSIVQRKVSDCRLPIVDIPNFLHLIVTKKLILNL